MSGFEYPQPKKVTLVTHTNPNADRLDALMADIKQVQAERDEAIRKDERQRIAGRVVLMCENVHRDGDQLYVRISDVMAAVRNEDTP